MTVRVLTGDCRQVLATLPDASVQMVCTSPPYYGLRDYGTASWEGGDAECGHTPEGLGGATERRASTLGGGVGTIAVQDAASRAFRTTCGKCGARRIDAQIGLERSVDEYVAELVAVFREVRRVLRDDATLWLNLGDSYSNTGGMTGGTNGKEGSVKREGRMFKGAYRPLMLGLKPKDLIGVPWMVAFALRADGWYLRSDIIWSKPNPMPESVRDRPTKAHEYVFLMSKSARYFFDAEAVREPHQEPWRSTGKMERTQMGSDRGRRGLVPDGGVMPRLYNPAGRNIRSVWTIATHPYAEAHFATFPPDLAERCIKAGTSERGACAACGAPWVRVVERTPMEIDRSNGHASMGEFGRTRSSGTMTKAPTSETTGWQPTCPCDADVTPCVVLDPFGGAGTVGLVADRLGRDAILIELNPEYVEMARKRITDDSPMFAAVQVS